MPTPAVRRRLSLLSVQPHVGLAPVAALLVAAAQAQPVPGCGDLQNAFGPWDYRPAFYIAPSGDNMSQQEKLHLVERAHFTPGVESLLQGNTSRAPGPDLDYTLRAFPNHHRALVSVIRLGELEKTPQPRGMRYTVECWLDRAAWFQPEDVIVRMIRAGYYAKHDRRSDALKDLDAAAAVAGDSPFTHYNLGLSYVEVEAWDQALAEAHRAMALGMPRTDLRERLVAAGKWRDPEPEAAATPASGKASEPTQ